MKWIKLIFVLLLAFESQGQYDGQDSLIKSRYRPGFMWFYTGLRPAELEKARKYDRFMIDVSYSLFQNEKELIKTLPQTSIGTSFHFMFDKPLTERNGIAIGFGLSYKIQRIGYLGTLNPGPLNPGSVLYDKFQFGFVTKTTFVNHSLAIPLELRFRMKRWKHAKFHAGGFVGYRFLSSNKIWFNENKNVDIYRYTNEKNPIDYGVHVRLGIRNWAIFGSYSFAKQFINKESVVLNPLSFGLTISLF